MSETFILSLPLKLNPQLRKMLRISFDAARNIYNGCLSEALNRLKLTKASAEWKEAAQMAPSKQRSLLFKEATQKAQFSEYSLHAFVKTLTKNCWIGDHIDSACAQKLATRAFNAVKEYSLRKRGRPRFKGINQLNSIEGKSNLSGIRFKEGKIHWKKLVLELVYDSKDKDGVEAHALAHRTKYVRIVRKIIRGKTCYVAQLIQEGTPLIKKKHPIARDKVVGLDLGPSTVAIVGEHKAELLQFCSNILEKKKVIHNIERKIDRSRRSTNPGKFSSKGCIIANSVPWKRSKKYIALNAILREEKRILAAARLTEQARLANSLLSLGNIFKVEKLNYKQFQKQYGRSVSLRAPGLFVEILRRKAANAGGQMIEFNTYSTKLSQTCHNCDSVKKKDLGMRWHNCNCGLPSVQRDLYSAFLARYVENDILDRSLAKIAWPGAEPLLEQALSRCKEAANRSHKISSFGIFQRKSGLPVKHGSAKHEVSYIELKSNVYVEECLGLVMRTPLL